MLLTLLSLKYSLRLPCVFSLPTAGEVAQRYPALTVGCPGEFQCYLLLSQNERTARVAHLTLFLYHCQRPHLPCPTVVFQKRVCVCSAFRTQPCVSISCSFPHAAQLSAYCAYLGTSLPPNTLISNTLARITKAIFYTFSGQ